jgi:RNA-directed DNA polymerase
VKGLVSVRLLAKTLGVPRDQLELLAANINAHYHEWEQTHPRTGKTRTLRSPSKELKAVQSRIAKRLFGSVVLGEEVQGGVRGKSPKTNAEMHVAKPCLVAVDVRKFFPSVRPEVVYQMLRAEFEFGRDVAALVTRLVTLDRQLPQGAPTSGVIANVLMRVPVDKPVLALSNSIGCDFTRFIDDLAISGRDPKEVINLIARSLSKLHLAISRKDKLKIMPRTGRQEITGLLVNGLRPSISKTRRDRVRAAIHQMQRGHDSKGRRKVVQSLHGRIQHVRLFNAGNARRLERQLADEGRAAAPK